jgi:hypothetical protein
MKAQMRNLAIVFALLAAACGGKETTASRSDAALREAQAKGVPVGGDGHEHGHGGDPATTTGVDHSAHGTTTDAHAAMDHSTMDHSTMAPADHAAMGHATTGAAAHAGHGVSTGTAGHTDAHAGHGSSSTSASQHAGHSQSSGASSAHAGHTPSAAAPSQHAGHSQSSDAPDAHAGHTPSAAAPSQHTGHSQTPTPASAHAGHGATHTAAPAVEIRAPASNAEIARTQPAATLRGDEFDAPAATSVSEAAKAAGGGGNHAGHDSASLYVCPMHPEVTSATPGTCPKCGMALVKKDRK